MGRGSSLKGGEGDGTLRQGHDVGVLAGAENPGILAPDRLLGLGQVVGIAAGRRVELVRLPRRILLLSLVYAPALRSRRLEQHSHVSYVECFTCDYAGDR